MVQQVMVAVVSADEFDHGLQFRDKPLQGRLGLFQGHEQLRHFIGLQKFLVLVV
jgi:hypothetical protein